MNNGTRRFAQDLFPSLSDIPEQIRLDRPVHQRQMLINGALKVPTRPTYEVTSPIYIVDKTLGTVDRLLVGSYPLGTIQDANEALDAAVLAYNSGKGQWPSMRMQERVDIIRKFTSKMLGKRDEIVKLIVWEIGKTITDAEKEFDRTVDYIHETITAANKLNNLNTKLNSDKGFIGQTKKLPFGVVLCMGPFNYPLNETFTTLIPALIMGNTVLFKPPKHGTLLFEPLLEVFAEVFPAGVVNTVYGRGRNVVPALMESGKIDVLALIGSSKVADNLKKLHPKSNRLKAVLGLDAKNAAIIMADSDLSLAVNECIAGALSFNGQRCTALKILFVHKSVAEEFNTLLAKAIEKLNIGMPWEKGVTITPLAEPEKPLYLKELINDALTHGATVINESNLGGLMHYSLVKPAILYPVTSSMRIYHEEQFGPVIPVAPFEDLQIPVQYITNSPYGQQVSIFGEDHSTVAQLIDMLAGQVGRININCQCQRSPDSFAFNGRKDSAEGTLSVDEALLAFSTDSVVAAKISASSDPLFQRILTKNVSKRLSYAVAE